MEYQKKIRFAGDADRAVRFGVETLTSQGFRITRHHAASAELAGPGMSSSKQNPLVGASHVEVRGRSGELSLVAQLGAVRRLIRVMALFLLGLALGLAVLFGILFRDRHLLQILLLALAPFVAWPAILALLGIVFRKRTCAALDTLLDNMAAIGKNAR